MAQQGVDFPLKNALKADPENLISYLEITGMGCVPAENVSSMRFRK